LLTALAANPAAARHDCRHRRRRARPKQRSGESKAATIAKARHGGRVTLRNW